MSPLSQVTWDNRIKAEAWPEFSCALFSFSLRSPGNSLGGNLHFFDKHSTQFLKHLDSFIGLVMEATMMCSENGFLFFLASSSKVPSAPSACSWAGLPKAHTPFLHTPPLIPGFPPDSSMAPDLHSAVFFLTVWKLTTFYLLCLQGSQRVLTLNCNNRATRKSYKSSSDLLKLSCL